MALVHQHAGTQGVFRVPEERVVAMMKSCADRVRVVTTIEDAKEVATAAEAIAAIARKVDVAKEIKRSAIHLLVEAEKKLGSICAAMPLRGSPGKVETLAKHGINRARTNTAQRLAKVPQEKIDLVIDEGANTLHGVTSKLGLVSSTYDLREKKAAMMAFLCEEAVALLDRCVKRGVVPHAGTVAEMVKRLANIKAHRNTKHGGYVR